MPIRAVNDSPKRPVEEALPPSARVSPRPRIRAVAQPAASPAPGQPAEPEPGEYRVGYGKPPLHTQFKKGQSGNARGRRVDAKGLKKIVKESLLAKVVVRTEAGPKKVSRIEAIILKQLEQAIKGNQRAAIQLVNLYDSAVPGQPEHEASDAQETLTATDEAILALFRKQVLAEHGEGQ